MRQIIANGNLGNQSQHQYNPSVINSAHLSLMIQALCGRSLLIALLRQRNVLNDILKRFSGCENFGEYSLGWLKLSEVQLISYAKAFDKRLRSAVSNFYEMNLANDSVATHAAFLITLLFNFVSESLEVVADEPNERAEKWPTQCWNNN